MNQNCFNKKNPALALVLFLSVIALSGIQMECYAQSDVWLAGVARLDITPGDSLWMAGYASRDHAAEGTMHQLWAKALALEDRNGNRGVLVTSDLLGFPKNISDKIRDQCERKYQLARSQIILSSSHTHSGPFLRESLSHVYPLSDEHIGKTEEYSSELEKDIVGLVGQALENMAPARIYADNGVVRFQVNRRNNNSATLSSQTDLNGPNDYAVPVLQVRQSNDELIAAAFGYACHPTVLNSYSWSGDYPGFAQLALEERYPQASALFFQGCGADQNPLPRRSESLARQYGLELEAAVDRVIRNHSEAVPSDLRTGYSEIELSFSRPPTEETLKKIAANTTTPYQQKWAAQMLDILHKGELFPASYPYPVQIWKLGDQPIIALGGEVVIDYAIQLKRIFGQEVFVMGYCNDVMGYIPSARILREGGYEGAVSQMVYMLPGTWKADLETKIIHEVLQLAEKTGIEIPESELSTQ